jgi:hypothetical protein
MSISERFITKGLDEQGLLDADALKIAASQLEEIIVNKCPEGRLKSLALTELELVVMWGVKAISRKTSDKKDK